MQEAAAPVAQAQARTAQEGRGAAKTERRRLERQGEVTMHRGCTLGVKQNAKGFRTHWVGC